MNSAKSLIFCASAFIFGGGALAQNAVTQSEVNNTVPQITLSQNILALTEVERTTWLHGAVSQLVQGYAHANPDIDKCLSDWIFDLEAGVNAVTQHQEVYADEFASVSLRILAVSVETCRVTLQLDTVADL